MIDENIFKTKKLKNEYPSVNKAYDIIIVNIDKNTFIIDEQRNMLIDLINVSMLLKKLNITVSIIIIIKKIFDKTYSSFIQNS